MEKTIRTFINEMSYEKSLAEMEELVIEYQTTLIEFIAADRFVFEKRDLLDEVYALIRSDRYFNMLGSLINSSDERINPDMAYVLHAATQFDTDDDLKGEALMLGYKLRSEELGDLIPVPEVNTCIMIAATKGLRGYETNSFMRTKCVENILTNLPDVLYNAFNNKYDCKVISTKVIFTILTNAVPDLTPVEVVTAFCKTQFPQDLSAEVRPYALRLRAVLYEICGMMNVSDLNKAVLASCRSIDNYNKRRRANESLSNKYLDFGLLDKIVRTTNNVPASMLQAHNVLQTFKLNNKQYEYLF